MRTLALPTVASSLALGVLLAGCTGLDGSVNDSVVNYAQQELGVESNPLNTDTETMSGFWGKTAPLASAPESSQLANDASETFMNFLGDNGFATESDQQTQTRATLTYFTGGASFA